jgi:hypothetical protein
MLLAILFLGNVFAADCVIPNLQVQDQDGMTICYGNSASLMAQATDPDKRPMSFIATALMGRYGAAGDRTQLANIISDRGTGFTGCEAFRNLQHHGTCPAETFPLEGGPFDPWVATQFLLTLEDYINLPPARQARALETLRQRARQAGSARDLAVLLKTPQANRANANVTNWLEGNCDPSLSVTSQEVALAQEVLDGILNFQGTGNPRIDFLRMVSPRCAAALARPGGNCTTLRSKNRPGDDFASATRIRNSICERQMPVSFNACGVMAQIRDLQTEVVTAANLEQQSNAMWGRLSQLNYKKKENCPEIPGHTAHVMTLVGARGEGNQEAYLVQNSWGRHCGLPRVDGSQLTRFAGIECEVDSSGQVTGRFWIPRSLFVNMSYYTGFVD